MLQEYVLCFKNSLYLHLKSFLVKKLLYLEAYLGVLVGIERCYARLCRAEACLSETLFFVFIEINVIRHYYLRSVGDEQLGGRYALRGHLVKLFKKSGNVERYTISYDVGRMIVKYSRRESMKRKSSIVIVDRMTCICTALESYHDVRFLCHHVSELAFSLVAPGSAYDCSYHLSDHSFRNRALCPYRMLYQYFTILPQFAAIVKY